MSLFLSSKIAPTRVKQQSGATALVEAMDEAGIGLHFETRPGDDSYGVTKALVFSPCPKDGDQVTLTKGRDLNITDKQKNLCKYYVYWTIPRTERPLTRNN